MSILDLLRNREVLTQIFRLAKRVAQMARSIAEARRMLAERLAEGARKGDFDPILRRLATNDELVKDFIDNG